MPKRALPYRGRAGAIFFISTVLGEDGGRACGLAIVLAALLLGVANFDLGAERRDLGD